MYKHFAICDNCGKEEALESEYRSAMGKPNDFAKIHFNVDSSSMYRRLDKVYLLCPQCLVDLKIINPEEKGGNAPGGFRSVEDRLLEIVRELVQESVEQ
jgi:protein-arginine kinase activator protein McsA